MMRVSQCNSRSTAMFSLVLVMLLSACSREDVSPLGTGSPRTERSAGQQQNEAMDQDGTLRGNTLRSLDDVIEGDGTDNGGISDDGDDEGDSERNRKNKGNS